MSVKFQRESLDEWLADAHKILPQHYEEASDVENDILNVDWDGYQALQEQGLLHVITGRNEQGELVAYWMGTIGPHGQTKHIVSSFDQAFWVRKDYRGITVLRLYKFLEQYYEELGVERSYHLVKPHKHRLDGIIEKLGYKHTDSLYMKVR
jgi:hypothetical protein